MQTKNKKKQQQIKSRQVNSSQVNSIHLRAGYKMTFSLLHELIAFGISTHHLTFWFRKAPMHVRMCVCLHIHVSYAKNHTLVMQLCGSINIIVTITIMPDDRHSDTTSTNTLGVYRKKEKLQ